jgi:uncharacterized protein DUF4242
VFLAELFLPERTPHERAEIVGRVREAAAGSAVRLARSIAVASDETCFLFFEAPSSEAVAAVAQRAGIAFDRISEADALS